MKLVTINNTTAGSPGAMLASGEVLHLAKAAKAGTLESWIPGSIREILESGADGLAIVKNLVKRVEAASPAELAQLRETGAVTGADTRLLTPVPNPRLIVAAGLAFKSHLAEMAGTPTPAKPTGFLKSVNSIVGSDVSISVPPDASGHIDYEGELAVVFGKTCHRVSTADAMSHVAGYMAANDVSARDWVKDVWEAKEVWPGRLTWEINIMGKQFDTFTPLGPVLATADDIGDVTALEIVTRLNGKEMQKAPISDLIFTLAETIAYFSKWYTFQPGDILLTGTPAGVGVGRKPPVFMKAGDVIEIEVSGIGTLKNTLKAAA
ncbi:MAG: fumarylacetoacetate hydrolase family protein [Pseudomonadota bacterium]